MKRYKGQSWMSYIGGKSVGYEAGELSIGIAHTSKDPRKLMSGIQMINLC